MRVFPGTKPDKSLDFEERTVYMMIEARLSLAAAIVENEQPDRTIAAAGLAA
jgi:hypothetical protein